MHRQYLILQLESFLLKFRDLDFDVCHLEIKD